MQEKKEISKIHRPKITGEGQTNKDNPKPKITDKNKQSIIYNVGI